MCFSERKRVQQSEEEESVKGSEPTKATTTSKELQGSFRFKIGFANQKGKCFRFIIEYSSLRDFGPPR